MLDSSEAPRCAGSQSFLSCSPPVRAARAGEPDVPRRRADRRRRLRRTGSQTARSASRTSASTRSRARRAARRTSRPTRTASRSSPSAATARTTRSSSRSSTAPALWRVTPGQGLTTCSHWHPDGKRMIWASTHLDPETYGPPPAEKGPYAWARHPSFDIFESDPTAGTSKRLTEHPGLRRRGQLLGGRHAHLLHERARRRRRDLHDGGRRLGRPARHAREPGYDGGPFFSPDGKRICFRGFRNPKNPRLANLYVIDADGKNEKQLTFDVAVNWAPFWHQNGDVLVWSKSLGRRPQLRALPDPALGQVDGPPHAEPGAGRPPGLLARRHEADVDVDARGRPLADLRRATSAFRPRRNGAPGPRKRRSASPTPRLTVGDATGSAGSAPAARRQAPLRRRDAGSPTTRCRAASAGTEGAANAADFIEATLQGGEARARRGRTGPAASRSTCSSTSRPGSSNELQIGSTSRQAARPVADGVHERAAGSTVDAWARSCSAGTESPRPACYDDYAGLPDVKGKVVLLFLRGIPGRAPDATTRTPTRWRSARATRRPRPRRTRARSASSSWRTRASALPSGAEVAAPRGPERRRRHPGRAHLTRGPREGARPGRLLARGARGSAEARLDPGASTSASTASLMTLHQRVPRQDRQRARDRPRPREA